MKQVFKRFLSLALAMLMVLTLLPAMTTTAWAATSGTVTGLADENIGLSYSGDADDAWSANGTSIIGSATSTGGTCEDTHYNSTLTITNNKTTKATLSFDYAIEQNSGTIQVDGTAVTAGGKLSMFFCCVFDALASTMATFAGQNVGAKRLDRINQGLKASSIIGCVYCVLAFVAIYFFGKPLVGLFISQDSADRQLVIDMAQQFLIINSVLYIPLLFVNIVRFSIQGLGYTMIAMIAGLMELVGRAVVAMLLVPSLGYDAACFANPVAWILADLFLIPCYFTCIRKLQKRLYPEKAAASSK